MILFVDYQVAKPERIAASGPRRHGEGSDENETPSENHAAQRRVKAATEEADDKDKQERKRPCRQDAGNERGKPAQADASLRILFPDRERGRCPLLDSVRARRSSRLNEESAQTEARG